MWFVLVMAPVRSFQVVADGVKSLLYCFFFCPFDPPVFVHTVMSSAYIVAFSCGISYNFHSSGAITMLNSIGNNTAPCGTPIPLGFVWLSSSFMPALIVNRRFCKKIPHNLAVCRIYLGSSSRRSLPRVEPSRKPFVRPPSRGLSFVCGAGGKKI